MLAWNSRLRQNEIAPGLSLALIGDASGRGHFEIGREPTRGVFDSRRLHLPDVPKARGGDVVFGPGDERQRAVRGQGN
jgi:hypothetical protein